MEHNLLDLFGLNQEITDDHVQIWYNGYQLIMTPYILCVMIVLSCFDMRMDEYRNTGRTCLILYLLPLFLEKNARMLLFWYDKLIITKTLYNWCRPNTYVFGFVLVTINNDSRRSVSIPDVSLSQYNQMEVWTQIYIYIVEYSMKMDDSRVPTSLGPAALRPRNGVVNPMQRQWFTRVDSPVLKHGLLENGP